jgi:hypothetical protein
MGHKIGIQRIPVASLGDPVNSAGKPVVIYGFNVISEVTGTGPDIRLYNDGDGNSDIVIKVNTAADVPTTVTFPEGITFPGGCFVDVEDVGNVVQVTVFYTVA